MNVIQLLLYPISFVYGLVMAVRNWAYDHQWFQSHSVDVKVISVGNLSLGGTGKTPHVNYLIELLKSKYQLSTLSRGYGRSSKGIVIADETSNAKVVGDEPFLFYQRYGQEILVVVSEDRVKGGERLRQVSQTDLVLLDDAYQHRSLNRDVNILLTDFENPFYQDFVFPSGKMRENRIGAKRADVILVTKCPNQLSELAQESIKDEIAEYSSAPVFFTKMIYQEAVFRSSPAPIEKVIAFHGVANGKPFENYLAQKYELVDVLAFKDHHTYSTKDFQKIRKLWEKYGDQGIVIVTTEKDWVKMYANASVFEGITICYLPIEVSFLSEQDESSFKTIVDKV